MEVKGKFTVTEAQRLISPDWSRKVPERFPQKRKTLFEKLELTKHFMERFTKLLESLKFS